MKDVLRKIFICTLLCVLSCHAYGQGVIREDGTIASFRSGDFKVDFFGQDKVAGPTFYIQQDSEKEYGGWTLDEQGRFGSRIGDISAWLQYLDTDDRITFRITLKNESDEVFAPVKAGVALGMADKAKELGGDGMVVASITLFAVLVYELIGPMLTKISLLKAGDIKPEGKTSARDVQKV